MNKQSMTLCLVLLLRNGRCIPWNKDVLTGPITRSLKIGMNQQIFDSVLPLLNEPPKLVEECNTIIIQYADEHCENDHPFIQTLLKNVIECNDGLFVGLRAFRTMKKKQELLHPYLIPLLDKIFPKEGKNVLKDNEMNGLINLINECIINMNQDQSVELFTHFNEILDTMTGCHERLTTRENEFVGLVNQGCTCYMNSVLQQIFHTKECLQHLMKNQIEMPTLTNPSEIDTENKKEEIEEENKFIV